MADNINVTPGAGATIAADEIGGVKFQRIKITVGADGVNGGDVSSANPMPVSQTGSATSANQDTANTHLGSIAGAVTSDDAVPSGSPVMTGGMAKDTDGTDPGSVVEGRAVRAIFDRNRRQLVNTAHPNMWTVNEDHTSAQTNNSLKGAPGANLSLYITDIIVSNGATAGSLKFVEDTGGTPAQKTGTLYLGINGGAVVNFETPIRITANKDFGFTSTTVTTHSITVNGYTAP